MIKKILFVVLLAPFLLLSEGIFAQSTNATGKVKVEYMPFSQFFTLQDNGHIQQRNDDFYWINEGQRKLVAVTQQQAKGYIDANPNLEKVYILYFEKKTDQIIYFKKRNNIKGSLMSANKREQAPEYLEK